MAKIVIWADTFPPNIGGSEAYLELMANGMGERGHEVTVITPRFKPTENIYRPAKNVSVRRSAIWKLLHELGDHNNPLINRFSRLVLLIFLYVKAFFVKADIAVVGHVLPSGLIAGAMKKRGLYKKIFVVTYGEEISMYRHGNRMRKLLIKVLQESDAISCLTHDSKLELEEICPETSKKILVLPPAVKSDESLKDPDDNIKLQGSPILFSVSRLVERKGIDRTLDALAALKNEFPEIHYYIAGQGRYQSVLEDQVNHLQLHKHVTFLGNVKEVNSWLRASDIFCMPNRTLENGEREGFGIVFLEAGLQKIPSIAGNSGGAVDAVKDGVTGFLVDPNSVSDIANAIRILANDKDVRQKMGLAAYEYAQSFSVHRFNETIDETLKKLSAR